MITSDKVLEIIFEALKFKLGEKGRFVTGIEKVSMNGDSLIVETMESATNNSKTQCWRIVPEHIVPVVLREEGNIELPTVEPVSKSDIETKTAKFWQSVFDTAVNDCESMRAGSGKYIGKIGLIKAFRALTGDGLKESKDAIDAACRMKIYIPMRDPGQTYEHWVIGMLPKEKKRR